MCLDLGGKGKKKVEVMDYSWVGMDSVSTAVDNLSTKSHRQAPALGQCVLMCAVAYRWQLVVQNLHAVFC